MKIQYLLMGAFTWLLSLSALNAQSMGTDWDQEKEAFVVKQYEEFVERFNFDSDAVIVKWFQENYPGHELDRDMLLRSLFNLEDPEWDPSVVDQFIEQMIDEDDPVFIDFYDESWYAEVSCLFEYNRRQYPGSLILQSKKYGNNSSKWQIVTVVADFLPAGDAVPPDDLFSAVRNPERILSPVSHATDFAALHRAFKDLPNLPNYFSKDQWSPKLYVFLREMMNGSLCLETVKDVTYHLLQIDGWIVSLKYYNRNLPNSGILISNILRADPPKKEGYKRKRLNIK